MYRNNLIQNTEIPVTSSENSSTDSSLMEEYRKKILLRRELQELIKRIKTPRGGGHYQVFIVATTHAFQSLIPEGKEVTYRYESTTSTETLYPKAAITKFNLHGILHLQKHNGSVFAKLTNLTYDLFNGLTDARYAVETLPIPEGLDDFSKTFKINYLPTGVVKGIAVGGNEKEYVVNFKKGLAAILQLDTQMLADKFMFESEEETLHGKQKVLYNVKLDNWEYYIDVMREGGRVHGDLLSSVEYVDDVDILRRDNQRSLKVIRKDMDAFVKYLKQSAGIYYNPFNGRGEEYTLRADQKLVLESVESIGEVMAVEGNEKTLEGLCYHEADFGKADTVFPDFTNGRRLLSNEIMVERAYVLVKQIFNAITQMKLEDGTPPDVKESHFLHSLTKMLLFFDEQMFSELELKLGEGENAKDYANIFHGLLSGVGTHASYNHMLNLRDKGKAGDSLFRNMFGNVKYPNKKLVDAMGKEILNWDSEKSEMYNSGVLSFATLLHKAAARHEAYKHNPEMREDYPDETYYEKFVLVFLEKLKNAESYEMQILYLQALYNARFNSTVEYLLPAVNGKWWDDEHLRMMAGLAINPVIAKNEDLAVKIYWPIMTNSKAMTSFRILAYYTIMKTKPSLQRLFNIYFVMESVKNEELYKFHYSYITELAKSESPKYAKFRKDLIQILKYTRKPYSEGLTTYHNLNYYNQEYAFGEQVELLSIYSKKENELIILGSHGDNMSGLYSKPSKFLLRIAGFHPRLLQQLKFDTSSSNYLLTWNNFKEALFNFQDAQDTKFTLIIARNDQVTSTKASDGKGFHDMLRIFKHALLDFNVDSSGIQTGLELSRSLYLHVPTDLGFPVIFYDHAPNIEYQNIQISNKVIEDKMKLSFNVNLKNWNPSMKGLAFYNPFIDLYEGVEKLVSQELYGDLHFDASYDIAQGVFKCSWVKPENGVLYAERNYVQKMVYAVTDGFRNQSILQKSCEKCVDYQHVSLGEKYKTSKNWKRNYFNEVGTIYLKNIFDAEEPLPNELNPNLDIFVESGNINDFNDFIKLLMATKTFEELQPNDVNYGSYEVLKLDPHIPLNNIDLTLKLKSEYRKNVNYLHPAVVHKLKLDYIAGTPNKTYRTWFVDAEIKMDEGHINSEYKINIRRNYNAREDKGSIEGDLHYENDAYKSKTYLIIPEQNTTKANPMLFVEASGEKSQEQKENKMEYSTCFYSNAKSPIDNAKSLQCFFEHTAFRNHTFTIKSKNLGYGSSFMHIMDGLLIKEEGVLTTEDIPVDELRVYLEIPIKPSLDYKVKVYNRKYGEIFSVPRNLKFLLQQKSAYGPTVGIMHMFGLTNVCTVDQERKLVLSVSGEELEDAASKEWRLYLGSKRAGSKFEVWIMTTKDDNMAIKVILDDNIFTIDPKQKDSFMQVAWPDKLTINPSEKTYIFAIDGNQMEAQQSVFSNNWLYYVWVTNSPIVSVYLKQIGVHIVYNGNQASIEYPEVEGVEWNGICLNKN